MNTIKYISITASIIVAYIILLFIIRFLLSGFKVIKDEEENIKKSYGIWFSALFVTGSGLIYFLINATFEAIDLFIRIKQEMVSIEIIKIIGSLFLIAFSWFVIWQFVVSRLCNWLYRKSDAQSMDTNDIGFFLIKSALLIGVIFGLSPLLQMLLKLVMPQIEIPFYH